MNKLDLLIEEFQKEIRNKLEENNQTTNFAKLFEDFMMTIDEKASSFILRTDEDKDHIGYRAKMFIDAYYDMLNDKYYRTNEYYNLKRLVDFTELAANVYEGETCELTVDLEKPIKVQHGCKNTRVLGKIADAYKLPHFEDFRLVHSQVLNQKKLNGIMCLSIHPLDYMTMSDNNCNWESCMNWYSHGDYRIGTIEMMNSPMVVEAYLEADHPYYPIDNRSWTWSNKRWRCLYIVHPDIITEIKQYPYHNEFLSKEVLGWLKELAQKNNNWAYKDNLSSVKSSTWNEIDNTKMFIPALINLFLGLQNIGIVMIDAMDILEYKFNNLTYFSIIIFFNRII